MEMKYSAEDTKVVVFDRPPTALRNLLDLPMTVARTYYISIHDKLNSGDSQAYGTGLEANGVIVEKLKVFGENGDVIVLGIDKSGNGGEVENAEIEEHHQLSETVAYALRAFEQEIRKYQPDARLRVLDVIEARAHTVGETCINVVPEILKNGGIIFNFPSVTKEQQEGIDVKQVLSTVFGGISVLSFTNLHGTSKGDYPEFIKVGLYVGYVHLIGLTFFGLMSKKMAKAAMRAAAGMSIATVTLAAVYEATENMYIKCAIGLIGTMGTLAMALIK